MISSTNKNHEDILFCLTLVVSVVFDFTLGELPPGILQRKKLLKNLRRKQSCEMTGSSCFPKEEVVFKKQTNINLVT